MPKILFLAPIFFPDPQVGGIRLTQWARHLPEFGWTPLVLTRHHGYTATPETLAERVHPSVRVEYLGRRLPDSALRAQVADRKARYLRGFALQMLEAVSVPDVLVWKWRSLAPKAIEIARQWQPDVVLSSSPSHSIHFAGRRVAQALGVPWVADFRDPFSIDCRFRSHGAKKLLTPWFRKFERDIYRHADLCVHAIPIHARWASRAFPFARHKIGMLTNGIPSELMGIEFKSPTKKSGHNPVSIRAVGVLGVGAVSTIADAIRQLRGQGIDAEFRHVGHARDTHESIPTDLRDRIHLLGPVSHREALHEIAGADILLKFDDLERAQVLGLSSKLFEYLATGRPIVAVNPTRSDWLLVEHRPWCWCLENPGPEALAHALREAIITDPQAPAEWLEKFREKYNRRNQTRQLAIWLDELLA